ncbi:DUF6680 family protein [Devosia aurantiaca]|uniref:DUF6680 domain-containing protein n=1 Tax=Devosia aurantiaca TaxID=2714858 RepID=A0A6M1SMT0_9HYPH|nr:DUF6680 family protein [Devosia aurantiaca]NGP18430.1 hypothetical protein [Devosia aurantiaca]
MNEGFDWFAVVTAVAAILGPLIAIFVTRLSDNRKEVRDRQMAIFRTLMRTRRLPIHIEHVGALNLVEIEFVAEQAVLKAWREYLKNLSEPYPSQASEQIQSQFQQRRDLLLTKLISEIAKALDFHVEQIDIFEGNYIPQGWNDDDFEQRLIRKGLIDVLHGRRPLLMQPFVAQQSPYPPAPVVSAEASDKANG